MRVVNTDATSYQDQNPEKCLETAEKEKKKKYLSAWLKHYQKFTPFVVSAEVLLRVDAEATLKCTANRLTTKWKEPYPHTCG